MSTNAVNPKGSDYCPYDKVRVWPWQSEAAFNLSIDSLHLVVLPATLGCAIVDWFSFHLRLLGSQEGLKVKQRLMKLSSPMHSGASGEMWSINDRPSLRFVTDAIRLNRTGSITLEVTEDTFQDITPVPDVETSLLDSVEGKCILLVRRRPCLSFVTA